MGSPLLATVRLSTTVSNESLVTNTGQNWKGGVHILETEFILHNNEHFQLTATKYDRQY